MPPHCSACTATSISVFAILPTRLPWWNQEQWISRNSSVRRVESGAVDFTELERAARAAGIWPGVASFLLIVSDYMEQYRGSGLNLPGAVKDAAALGGNKIYTRGRFLRVPVMPYGARLYTRQLRETAFRGDVPATLRLSLLPPLASAAAVAFKVTGSDKGIW